MSAKNLQESLHLTFEQEFFGPEGETSWREIWRETLSDGQEVVFTTSVGALELGHCLMIPEENYTSFAQMPAPLLTEAIDLAYTFCGVLRDVFRPALGCNFFIAEHGAIAANSCISSAPEHALDFKAGACVDHAHLHLLPTLQNMLSVVASYEHIAGPWTTRITETAALNDFQQSPYLSLGLDPQFGLAVWENPSPQMGPYGRQFVRRAFEGMRCVAPRDRIIRDIVREIDNVSQNKSYDWRTNPKEQTMTETVQQVRLALQAGAGGHIAALLNKKQRLVS